MADVDVPICLRSSDGKLIAIDANCEDVELPVCVNATDGQLWIYHADCDGVGESDGWFQVCGAAGGGMQITIPDDCCEEPPPCNEIICTCSGPGEGATSYCQVYDANCELVCSAYFADGDPWSYECTGPGCDQPEGLRSNPPRGVSWFMDTDINMDGYVNVLDLIIVSNDMCKTVEEATNRRCDVDHDGLVTAHDFCLVWADLGWPY